MLQNDFFRIISSESLPPAPGQEGIENLRIVVELDPSHRIYAGHFPGNPVVPGVCEIQIVKEALFSVKGLQGVLVSAGNIKFLNIIKPSDNPVLTIDYALNQPGEDNLSVTAVITAGETVFMKFKGTLCTKPS
jgi:3-hydroxyacyl-[acyl-carrier-protein] dehydratase